MSLRCHARRNLSNVLLSQVPHLAATDATSQLFGPPDAIASFMLTVHLVLNGEAGHGSVDHFTAGGAIWHVGNP